MERRKEKAEAELTDSHWSHLRRSYYNKKDSLALESIQSNSQYSKL